MPNYRKLLIIWSLDLIFQIGIAILIAKTVTDWSVLINLTLPIIGLIATIIYRQAKNLKPYLVILIIIFSVSILNATWALINLI